MSDIVITEWGCVEDRIRELEAQIAALTAERDRYRAALVEIRDSRDASAKGLSYVARLALAGAAESEAS